MNNRFNPKDYDKIAQKTNYRCAICGSPYIEKIPHHIIFRNKVQGGTGHYENGIFLCYDCHYQIHHGLNSKEYQDKTYKYIKDINKCWDGKTEPKIIRILKQSRSYNVKRNTKM